MNTKNNLLILERSSSELEFKQDGDGAYVLEGILTYKNILLLLK